MQRASERLANGLRIELTSTPAAQQAAALISVECGSFHEPIPGLAHLLEHLLFADSTHFRQQQRLMPWVQGQQGQLNASTHACRSAFFFEVAADQLEAGVARLTDMMAHPLLQQSDIRREAQVIDAECQLLQKESRTQAAAALTSMLAAPAEAQRFQVGNAATFGDDLPALQAALRQLHQRYYVAGNMTLWLQGPHSLETLRQLAQRYGTLLPAGQAETPPLCMQASGASQRLRSASSALRLGWIVADADATTFSLLRQMIVDEASGSLLAQLRDRQLCQAIALDLTIVTPQTTLIVVDFSLLNATDDAATQVESLFYRWVQQLMQQPDAVLQHYAALDRTVFSALSPLRQLRARVLDCVPPASIDEAFLTRWQALLHQCQAASHLRQLSGENITGAPTLCQGFALSLTTLPLSAVPMADADAHFVFFSAPQNRATTEAPGGVPVALAHQPQNGEEVTLVLHPAPETGLANCGGEALRMALRTLAGDARHAGVNLCIEPEQGVWLLSLRGQGDALLPVLDALSARLLAMQEPHWQAGRAPAELAVRQAHDGIAIRALLAALPEALQPQAADVSDSWSGMLVGGDAWLHQAIARRLSPLPGWHHPVHPARHAAVARAVATSSRDRAILLFCPVPASARWQLLAQIYEPHFFQQLRVERQVGYVVSCRFHYCAGESGILFALQSPNWEYAALWQAIEDFLHAMTPLLGEVNAQQLDEHYQALMARAEESVRLRWLAAWRGDVERENRVTPDDLLAAHRQLQQLTGWRLSNQPVA